ncbi:MAG: DUF4266 domain-containing protein [Proteobacteria bacterium]|nr:DUF4266 domain-containing protein [Pseudomonadota bacterium]
MLRIAWVAATGLLLALLAQGCAPTRYYERRKLVDRAMLFDVDMRLEYIRNKTEAAREGSFGGYGAAAVGGCGCQ